jgi:hypothetical protein
VIRVYSPLELSIPWQDMAAFLVIITIHTVEPGKKFSWIIPHSIYLLFLCSLYLTPNSSIPIGWIIDSTPA